MQNAQVGLFESTRFQYVPIANDDQIHFTQLYCNAVVMEQIGSPLSVEQALAIFSSVIQPDNGRAAHFYKITCKQSLRTIGIMGFLPYSLQRRIKKAEFGIILYPHQQRKQVAPEAITALLCCGFEHLGIDLAYALFSSDNEAVKKVAQHLQLRVAPSVRNPEELKCEIAKLDFLPTHFQQH